MSNTVNLIALKPGDIVGMSDGQRVKIVENPGDGVWVFGAYLPPGAEDASDLSEEPIFAQDIAELISPIE